MSSKKFENELYDFLDLQVKNEILTQKQVDKLKHFIESYITFQQKIGDTKEQVYKKIGEKLPECIFDNLMGIKQGLFGDKEIQKLFREIPALELDKLGDLTPGDIVKEKLFLLGVYGLNDVKKITTGFVKASPQDPFFPSNIVVALMNLTDLFSDKQLRNILINHIQNQYGLEDIKEYITFNEYLTILERKESYSKLKKIVNDIKEELNEKITNLQGAFTFYNTCIDLYVPNSGYINIFSTSSGIVIPEEYHGDIRKNKNPYRIKYFDEGIAGIGGDPLIKYYQWDSEGTAEKLWKSYEEKGKDETYKNEAINIFSKFLQIPNLEISEAPFAEEPWKKLFTLVTRKDIVFSERGEMKKINHGIRINDTVLQENIKNYQEILSLLKSKDSDITSAMRNIYKRGECEVIKKKDDIKFRDEKIAKEKARDVVERLLERGKKISEIKTISFLPKDSKEKGNFTTATEIKEESKEEIIEMGLDEIGSPYILINNEPVLGTTDSSFSFLLLLCSIFSKEGGVPVDKRKVLKIRSGEQELSDIEKFLSKGNYKKEEIRQKKHKIKRFTGTGGICLDIFEKIMILPTICQYKPRKKRYIENIMTKASEVLEKEKSKGRILKEEEIEEAFYNAGIGTGIGDLDSLKRFYNHEIKPMIIHTYRVQRTAEIMGWEFHNEKWRKKYNSLLIKCKELADILGIPD